MTFCPLPSIESKNSKCCLALPEAWAPVYAGTPAELLHRFRQKQRPLVRNRTRNRRIERKNGTKSYHRKIATFGTKSYRGNKQNIDIGTKSYRKHAKRRRWYEIAPETATTVTFGTKSYRHKAKRRHVYEIVSETVKNSDLWYEFVPEASKQTTSIVQNHTRNKQKSGISTASYHKQPTITTFATKSYQNSQRQRPLVRNLVRELGINNDMGTNQRRTCTGKSSDIPHETVPETGKTATLVRNRTKNIGI